MLKLSGEALQGGMGFGVDPKVGGKLMCNRQHCSICLGAFLQCDASTPFSTNAAASWQGCEA